MLVNEKHAVDIVMSKIDQKQITATHKRNKQ